MLETRNVYLDTQTFVQNNYFKGGKIQDLFSFAEEKHVKLLITEITLNEIKSNIREDIETASQEVEKYRKAINGKGKIVKNLEKSGYFLNVPEIVVEDAINELNEKLEALITEGIISIMPYSEIDLKGIFEKYFKGEKPFGPGKKKSEFPDAVVIAALEKWCLDKKQKIYFISGDKDFSGITLNNIELIMGLPSLLDKINKQINHDRYDLANILFVGNIEAIEKQIKNKFSYKIKDEIWFDISIDEVNITSFKIIDHSVESLDFDEANIHVDFNIEYTLEVTYEDCSSAFYDKEDDKYYGCQTATVTLEQDGRYTAEINIAADFENNDAYQSVKIDCNEVEAPDEADISDQLEGYVFRF